MQMYNNYKPRELISQIMNGGVDVEVRGEKTREDVGKAVWLDGHNLVLREELDPLLGVLLSQFILARHEEPELLVKYAKGLDAAIPWRNFEDASRVGDQLGFSVSELLTNPTSRRAILYVGRAYDEPSGSPCIESVQFLRRYGFLYTIVNVRSWDMVKEMPLDVLTWGLVSQAVSHCLEAGPVRMRFNVASAHVYHKDLEIAKNMCHGSMNTLDIMRMRTLGDYKQLADSTIGLLQLNNDWEDVMSQVLAYPYVRGS